ncbi:zf-HC2 domain-containing protein [Paeniglutamicibacter antarcticus]|uniref:Putative zinc-finger domain-containing protein n=1 Tax=Paeniglutamicibacter antarcticus TaxID=494023 RepID=A0ABP9TT37_9MICC
MHQQERWLGDYADGLLRGRRRKSLEKHLGYCDSCSAALGSDQGMGRGAAFSGRNFEPLNAQTLLGAHYSLPQDRGAGTRRGIGVVPMIVFLLVFALVASIAAMSWILGAPAANAAPEHDPAESWGSTARSLDAGALSELRQAGWTCPVIEAAGFTLASASGQLKKGEATVTMVLSDSDTDSHRTVELAETRALPGAKDVGLRKTASAGATTDPTSGMLTELGHRLGAKAAAAVTYADGTATLNMEDVKYKVSTNLSKADVEQILQRLVVGEHTHIVSFDQGSENIPQRMLRGFSRLMVLDFK